MCCEYLTTMTYVEIFLHYTTIISNMSHGSTLFKAITCSSHFAYMRARTSPCSQLGCFSFLIWISDDVCELEEVAFFLPLLHFFHEPSSLLLCPFTLIGNMLLTRRWCSWNLMITFKYVALYWKQLVNLKLTWIKIWWLFLEFYN